MYHRCEVQLLDWSRPLCTGTATLMSTAKDPARPNVRPRASNLTVVITPPPLVLVAYSVRGASKADLDGFLAQELPKLESDMAAGGRRPLLQTITCTPREMRMLIRALDGTAGAMAMSAATRSKVG